MTINEAKEKIDIVVGLTKMIAEYKKLTESMMEQLEASFQKIGELEAENAQLKKQMDRHIRR